MKNIQNSVFFYNRRTKIILQAPGVPKTAVP